MAVANWLNAAAQAYSGGAGGGGGGQVWSFSQSGSADANNQFGDAGGFSIGGINTGTQGLDLTTIAIIGGIVLVALVILKR